MDSKYRKSFTKFRVQRKLFKPQYLQSPFSDTPLRRDRRKGKRHTISEDYFELYVFIYFKRENLLYLYYF